MATVAWIGLGHMGGPMAANLAGAGHTVRGYDVNPEALAAAAASGVSAAASIADAVADADVVFTMLPKGEHVRAVHLGEDGVTTHARPGLLLVDCSTIEIETAADLHREARDRGLRFVDAPVSGGVSGAAAGTLTFMLGGEEADVAEASTYLGPMAANIIPTGAATSGQAAKICNNMMLFIELQACAEGAALANRLGLGPKVFWDIVNVSSGACWAQKTWWPVPGLVESAASNRGFEATFPAALAHKDVQLALSEGERVGLDLPAARVADDSMLKLMDEGYGDLDCSLIIRTIDPEAPGVPHDREG